VAVKPVVEQPTSEQPASIAKAVSPIESERPVTREPVVSPETLRPTPVKSSPAASPAPPSITANAAAVDPAMPVRPVREPVVELNDPRTQVAGVIPEKDSVPAPVRSASPSPDQPVVHREPVVPPAPTTVAPLEEESFANVTWRQVSARARVVSVLGTPANAQWRLAGGAGDGAWLAVREGDQLTGKIEVRTGVGAALVLEIDDAAQLEVDRLSRVIVTRALPSRGPAVAGVEIERGRVQVRAKASGGDTRRPLARVQTPDQNVEVRTDAMVEYNAFTGTRRGAAD
jgi:hypothetical protein